jgi:hypothetical protein
LTPARKSCCNALETQEVMDENPYKAPQEQWKKLAKRQGRWDIWTVALVVLCAAAAAICFLEAAVQILRGFGANISVPAPTDFI